MRDFGQFNADAVRALGLTGAAANAAAGPEEALWTITRALPELLGDRAAHLEPGNLKPGESQQFACCCFVVTSDAKHNLLVAPVNFGPAQRHQKIDIALGHPGHVVKTRQPLLLANTDHHQSFVKILETFRAGSALFAPLLWREKAIGVIVCAAQARNTFSEMDLAVHVAFSHLAAAQWIAHGGSAGLKTPA
jgi:hypothetical protein